MPSQVRIISGPRNRAWDSYIKDVIDRSAWKIEHDYFGITSPERADHVRRKLRTAGRHHDVRVKAYWIECTGCSDGGRNCRYHVKYTVYSAEEARSYMQRRAQERR